MRTLIACCCGLDACGRARARFGLGKAAWIPQAAGGEGGPAALRGAGLHGDRVGKGSASAGGCGAVARGRGLSPAAAVARVTGADSTVASTSTLASTSCNYVEYATHRGIFPYHRWVQGQTYWCYYYGGPDHVPGQLHLGAGRRSVLGQQPARLEGRRRSRVLLGDRPSRGRLLVRHALVVSLERHALDGGSVRLVRKRVANAHELRVAAAVRHPLRIVVVVLLAAVLLTLAGWVVTVVLFKSGGRVEEPHQLALRLSR